MYHEPCGEVHRPTEICPDGVDRMHWLVPIIDHPLLVAAGRSVIALTVVLIVLHLAVMYG